MLKSTIRLNLFPNQTQTLTKHQKKNPGDSVNPAISNKHNVFWLQTTEFENDTISASDHNLENQFSL